MGRDREMRPGEQGSAAGGDHTPVQPPLDKPCLSCHRRCGRTRPEAPPRQKLTASSWPTRPGYASTYLIGCHRRGPVWAPPVHLPKRPA